MNEIAYNRRKSKKYFNILFLCCLFRNTVVQFLLLVVGRLPVIGSYNYYLYYLLIILLIVLAFSEFRKFQKKDILFIGFAVFSVVFSFCVDNNKYLSENIVSLLLTVYPFYFLGRNFNYHDEVVIGKKSFSMEDTIYVLSVIGIILTFALQWYSMMQGSYNSVMENSGGATYTKPLLGFCCFYMFKHRKIHSIIIVIVGFIAMFSYANRTSLLAVFIILIISSLYYIDIKRAKSFALLAGEIIVAIVVLFNYKTLINYIGNILANLGFNARITNMFLGTASKSLLDDNGRSFIYSVIRQAINDRPIGYGLYGDRKLLETWNGNYSHNLFLELLVDYGWIIGAVLCALFVAIIIRGIIRNSDDKDTLSFILVLGISEIVMLMLSGSYLKEGMFFMLIGLCLSTKSNITRRAS